MPEPMEEGAAVEAGARAMHTRDLSDWEPEAAAVEAAGGFVPRKDDASGIRQSDDGASPKTTEPAHPTPSLPPRERVEGEGLGCTHSWRTCPVHGTGGDSLPPFRRVLTCLYGGMELKDGDVWTQDTSDDVTARIVGDKPPSKVPYRPYPDSPTSNYYDQ